jgi:hypothetical protein
VSAGRTASVTPPLRTFREHPDLDQLKRQAKELDADPATFALHAAQLVLARAYGFESWPKLKALVDVDGATVSQLTAAVRAGDAQGPTILDRDVQVLPSHEPQIGGSDVRTIEPRRYFTSSLRAVPRARRRARPGSGGLVRG